MLWPFTHAELSFLASENGALRKHSPKQINLKKKTKKKKRSFRVVVWTEKMEIIENNDILF